MTYVNVRFDHKAILKLVNQRSTVLELGCGSGDLLSLLTKERSVRGQGLEIDEKAIYACVAKGLNVIHGDIDSGLAEYEDKSFDYVILNQSLQQIKHPDTVLTDALRVGRKVIISFSNFAYYKSRLQIFFQGRTPVTGALPYQWYETPNLHFLSVSDFIYYCRLKDVRIERSMYISGSGSVKLFPNLFAQTAIFLVDRGL
ncbi:MAG TPA: methionine biosynthesis protein MetW [Thermodesulfobacteriota bacterium]|nr:methionine biosynthesis protein MetW [Thermodesulfobacteriota bacterium]